MAECLSSMNKAQDSINVTGKQTNKQKKTLRGGRLWSLYLGYIRCQYNLKYCLNETTVSIIFTWTLGFETCWGDITVKCTIQSYMIIKWTKWLSSSTWINKENEGIITKKKKISPTNSILAFIHGSFKHFYGALLVNSFLLHLQRSLFSSHFQLFRNTDGLGNCVSGV